MITKIRLKNWKSHLDSEFTFTSGVNALMGIMGSGKSSVMQAISFALFGTFPSHQMRKVSLDELVMTKPHKQKKAEVELEFMVNGNDYFIRRVLEYAKGTTHAEIRKGKQMLEVNPAGVTREVERILGIDYELFSKAVYSEQDGMDYFLRIPKGQRMVQIDRMIKLDRFGKVRERSVSLKNQIIDRRKEKMRFVLEMEKEDFSDKIAALEEELKSLEQDSGVLKESAERVSQKKDKMIKEVTRFEDRESELNSMRVSIGSVNAGIKEIGDQVRERQKRMKDRNVAELNEEFERVKEGIKRLGNEIGKHNDNERELRDKISENNTKIMILTKNEIPKLEESIEAMDKDWIRFRSFAKRYGSDPEKELNEKSRELDSMKKHVFNLEARKMEILESLDQLKSADVKCPVCDSDLDEHKKEELISHRINATEELDRDIASNRKKVKKMEAAVKDIESAGKNITILKERLKDYDSVKENLDNSKKLAGELRKDVSKAVSLMQDFKKNTEKLKEKLQTKEDEREQLQSIINDMDSIAELQQRLNGYLDKKNGLEKGMKSIEDELRGIDIKELRSSLQKNVAEESEINAKLASIEEKIADRKKNLGELKKRKEIMDKYKKEVLRDETIVMKLETFVKVLRVTQEQLREEFLKTVNTIMNRIWDELYPYGDFSEIKLMVDDGDYVLKLRGSEGWIPVEGVASGGERSMSVLALRVAFSLAFIPNLRWLILDEPTHNLDTNAISHFAEVLRNKMDRFAEQVFLITHEEGISNGITGQLYRLERNKAANEATRIKANEE